MHKPQNILTWLVLLRCRSRAVFAAGEGALEDFRARLQILAIARAPQCATPQSSRGLDVSLPSRPSLASPP